MRDTPVDLDDFGAELSAILGRLDDAVEDEIKPAVTKGARVAKKEWSANAPKDTGAYDKSISYTVRGSGSEVSAEVGSKTLPGLPERPGHPGQCSPEPRRLPRPERLPDPLRPRMPSGRRRPGAAFRIRKKNSGALPGVNWIGKKSACWLPSAPKRRKSRSCSRNWISRPYTPTAKNPAPCSRKSTRAGKRWLP